MRKTPLLLLSLFLAVTASADMFVPQSTASRILIPAAADAVGANGTHFRSNIEIINYRSSDQRVLLRWYPFGGTGTAPERIITIQGRRVVSSGNFVTNVLNQSGLGAIEVIGIDAAGNVDNAAMLHVTSRVWTPAPNAPQGELSQTFPAIVMTSNTGQRKTIFGMHRGDEFRYNVGIVNPSSTAQTFRITIVTQFGNPQVVETTLQPFSMYQANMPGNEEVLQTVIENITTQNISTTWQAYGSSVNNFSGDAWSQMAFPLPAQTP
ncbi:MAG TPA: hypothetical protein VF846_04215 [Thermoanaerobaculia bacterium]|jgi:hypothetical protein